MDKEQELAILSIPQDKDTDELRRELLKEKLNNIYKYTQAESKYTLAIDIDPNNFKLGQGDRLYAKRGTRSWVELTYKSNPRKFRSLNTIQKIAGVEFIRKVLGFSDYQPRKTSEDLAREKIMLVQTENVPIKELPRAADQTSEIVNDLIASEERAESEAQTDEQNYLKYRELVALDESLQTIKGSLELNQAKLDELDARIRETRNELDEAHEEEREEERSM